MALTIGLYQVLPESYQAVQITKSDAADIAAWCGGVVVSVPNPQDPTKPFVAVDVPIYGGVRRARELDWVLKQPGSFTTIDPDTFARFYAKV